MTRPAVSVVIPCYNAAAFLRDTLDSVLAQTYRPLEVLVIDDGSTDESARIAEAYGDPIRVIRQENQGESIARNRGIDEAKGEWIAFLDADDVWRPTKLERQVDVIGPDVVAVHTNLYNFGAFTGRSYIEEVPEDERYAVELLAVKNTFIGPSSTLLVRRSMSPRFPIWTKYAEDMIYLLELVQRGTIKLVEEPLAGYRRHSKSQSANPVAYSKWFETIEAWLDKESTMDAVKKQRVIDSWIDLLCQRALKMKWNRHWKEYWHLRNYLDRFRGLRDVDQVLDERIYPRWFYRVADRLPERAVQH